MGRPQSRAKKKHAKSNSSDHAAMIEPPGPPPRVRRLVKYGPLIFAFVARVGKFGPARVTYPSRSHDDDMEQLRIRAEGRKSQDVQIDREGPSESAPRRIRSGTYASRLGDKTATIMKDIIIYYLLTEKPRRRS